MTDKLTFRCKDMFYLNKNFFLTNLQIYFYDSLIIKNCKIQILFCILLSYLYYFFQKTIDHTYLYPSSIYSYL